MGLNLIIRFSIIIEIGIIHLFFTLRGLTPLFAIFHDNRQKNSMNSKYRILGKELMIVKVNPKFFASPYILGNFGKTPSY